MNLLFWVRVGMAVGGSDGAVTAEGVRVPGLL